MKELKNNICGEFPDFCYKTYDCEDYANQFVFSGKFRLGCLGYYRNIEDIFRCDQTEGFGCTREPGEFSVGWVSSNPKEKTIWAIEKGHQEHHSELGNKIYCFSTYLPEVRFGHILKMGNYIVKINNPRKLAEDINEYLLHLKKRFLIVGCRVVYNKGQKLEEKLTDNERLDLAYKQKPEKFSPECEFRIIAIAMVTHVAMNVNS